MPRDAAAATAARRAALQVLAGCRRGQMFEPAFEAAAGTLAERDRRLAHELAAGVLRRQTELDRALAPLVTRDWEKVPPALRDILRLGAYQLRALDRVPPHAAVATSVALARQAQGERASGFVNAVLRKLAANPSLPDDESGSTSSTHPTWLLDRWRARFGPENTAALVEWNDTRPRLAVQPARTSLPELVARWRDQGVQVTPAPYDAGVYVDARRPDQLEGFEEGAFLVQDPAQALVARYAGVGDTLAYDACAAPGGKTLALSHQGTRVVAGDKSRLRVTRLRHNLARAGRGAEWALVADAAHPPIREVAAVLLDAPCLGTGTFARHPDARWRVDPGGLEQLVEQQRALLDAVASIVRPGGMLVYATCSLEPEENACQVEAFLGRHPEFQREPNRDLPPDLLTPAGDLAILPFKHRMDGAFAARLRRIPA